ncbi:MAG TPA: peptidylprolyl isomerase [Kofleriaceae bacterium]
MRQLVIALAATAALAGCPAPVPPASAPDTALRIRIAQAEARRAGGVAELGQLAAQGPVAQRALALRGLGRTGATGVLAALRDPDPEIVGAAAAAIGVAASLDDAELGATDALVRALDRGGPAGPAIVEALGRAGTVAAQPALVRALRAPALAEQAALALARHGRRKLAWSPASRAAVVAAASSRDDAVRYAAVYALAREHQPPDEPGPTAALIAVLADPIAEIRAQAIAGLGKRKAIAAARARHAPLDALLLDRDWRVAAEAVRALADGPEGQDAIAASLIQRIDRLAGDPSSAQVILEAEHALSGAADRPAVAAALTRLAEPGAATVPALTRAWIRCLAVAATLHGRADADLAPALACELPPGIGLPLVGELIQAGTGALASRRAALGRLLGDRDPRVRAAGLGALAALAKAGDEHDRQVASAQVVAGLAASDLIVASAAVDAATSLREAGPAPDVDRAAIDRASRERDPELGVALLELIGKLGLADGAPACRAALTGDAVRARAGAKCLEALGTPVPPPAATAPALPPVDVASVIGKTIRWRVETTRGALVIQLRPDVAPWAVAAIVALTRKHFYDGLAFHRVVPNFVVQGGDPTESGSGGPGFTLPAEPASLRDGAGYRTGGAGIADAGRDSGGSQWFVMHGRAPHLDGRYTWFGSVVSGQNVADSLLIGDKIVRATIELAP